MEDNFKIIVITSPSDVISEAEKIELLLNLGIWRVHIRKPEWDINKTENLLKTISPSVRRNITLHDHFALAHKYECGVQTNSRNKTSPQCVSIISHSCHSLTEAKSLKCQRTYVTLSPIFQSISKPGYGGDMSILQKMTGIDLSDYPPLIALSGINFDNIPVIKEKKFSGAALLGAVWNDFEYALKKIKILCFNS